MSMITVPELITRERGRERGREGGMETEREDSVIYSTKSCSSGQRLLKQGLKRLFFLFADLPHIDQNKLKWGEGGRKSVSPYVTP